MNEALPLSIEATQIRRETDKQPTCDRMTICTLLYGDHKNLAERCLESIRKLPNETGDIELRIGMNAVGDATRQYVVDLFKEENAKNHNVLLFDSTTNRGKYPLMRWMLHGSAPIRSPYVMWFDDDSYITDLALVTSVEYVLVDADICGELMTTPLTLNQAMWVQMQPWYHGKSMRCKNTVAEHTPSYYGVNCFPVGGWWTARYATLKKLDWPPPNIIHRGGDYMLGEAMHQNDMKMVHFAAGVAINADEAGNDHQAQRRGLDSLPVGMTYEPPLTAHLHLATKNIDPRLLDYAGM